MDSQDTIKVVVGLELSRLPQDVQAASNHLKPLGQAAQHVNQQITDAARAASEQARRYSEQYAHFWMKALDKQEQASRTAYEKMYADLLKHRDKSEKAEAAIADKRRKEVERIHAQTRKNAEDELKHREQIDKRMADNTISQRNRAMRDSANSFIQNNQPTGNGGGGGFGGVLNSLLQNAGNGGGGGGGIIGTLLQGGAGGGGGVPPILSGILGSAAGIASVVGILYGLLKVFELLKDSASAFASILQQGILSVGQYAAHIEQVAIGFETLLGSVDAAQQHMLDLAKFAESTPFEFDQLADASRRLLAMGVAASEVKTQLTAIGNAVSAVGGGAQQFERVVYAIGDIQAKGKLTGEEVRQLANNAIPVIRILTEELSISSKEARKLIENGKVTAEVFTQAFENFTERKFGDAMVKQSQTLIGALSNISDAFHLKAYTAFKPIYDAISDIVVRFANAMTGADGIVDLLANTSDEFSRTGGELAEKLINGIDEFLRNPATESRLLSSMARLAQALDPARILANGILSAGDAAITRLVARFDGTDPNTDQRGAEDLLEELKRSGARAPKNAPLPAAIKPNESFEDYQERLAKLSLDKQFSDLTGGGDGEKTLEKYQDALESLTMKIKFFGQESNEARERQRLLTLGFKDFNSEEAKALLATAKRLDALEAEKKRQKELAQAGETYANKVNEVNRSVDASIIDLTMNAETGANNLAKFYAKTAKQIEDAGAKAGLSSDKIAADIAKLATRYAEFDKASELASVGNEVLKVDSTIAKLQYRLNDVSPETELFYEVIERLGLSAKYGADGFEELTSKLDGLLSKLRERAKLEKDLEARREQKSKDEGDINNLQNFVKDLDEKLSDSRRGGRRKNAIDEFYDSLNKLKGVKFVKSELANFTDVLDSMESLEPATRLATFDAIFKSVSDSLEKAGVSGDKVGTLTTAIFDAYKKSKEAADELTPLQERRNQLDTEWRKLQEDVGIESEVAAKRYRNAWQEALNDVQMRDIEARESMIRSQVEIADQQVFHAEQSRASIYEHMASAKGYTDIVSDAFIGASDAIGDGMSSLFDKVNSGLGRFGDILTDIETSLLKMVTNRLLMKLVDGLLGGGSSSGGGGSSGGGFNPLSILTGGGRTGGTSPFNPNAPAFFNQLAPNGLGAVFGGQYGGSSLNSGDTLSGQVAQRDWLRQVGGDWVSGGIGNAAQRGGGMALGQSGILASLAQAAPLLGLSFGASIGGNLGRGSRLGSIMGTVGGAALGGLGALLGTGFGLSAATGVGAFSSFGALSAFAPIAASALPIAAIAAPLLIGAIILGRNSRRRQEETTRNDAMLDAFKQLDDIIRKVRNHQMDAGSGLSQATQIRESYVTEMSKLQDKKTRSHALADVSRIDARIATLRTAASGALNDNSRRNITAAFATGGVVSGQRGEPRVILAHGGEIVASLANQTPELVQAAAEAGIPNVRGGDSGGNRGRHTSLNVELHLGTDTRDRLVVDGMKSDAGYKVQTDNTRKARKNRDI